MTTFQLPGGSKDAAAETVSANAVFSIDSFGALTLTLTNLTAGEVSDGQAITGVKFDISSLTSAVALQSQTGHEIDISSGKVTDLGVAALTHWTASTALPTVTLTTIGGGKPINSILGPLSADGKYDNGNGSLGSVKNPWVVQSATFVFGVLPGFLPDRAGATYISNVLIGFGTAGTDYIQAAMTGQVVTATPEPGTLWLTGFCGAAFLIRRKLVRR
jgi:hypothetical protein